MCTLWLESLKGRDHLEDLDVDGEKLLNGSWENMVGWYGLGSSDAG
jgi:hypothetical protein